MRTPDFRAVVQAAGLRPTALIGALTLLAALTGCLSVNHKITGQTDMYRTDTFGDITAGALEPSTPVAITKGTTFSIRLDSVFVRNVKELGGSEFLVYAEIFDVQPDDRQKLVKVMFKENNQAPGYLINQRDRLMFGPITYTGNPIRIRLFVVELDGGENRILSEVLKQAVRIASSTQPGVAALSESVTTAGDLFLSLNQDDRELMFDFTLFPRSHTKGPYLETGHIVLLKTENTRRFPSGKKRPAQAVSFGTRTPAGAGQPAGVVYRETDLIIDEYGRRIDGQLEDFATLFSYSDDEQVSGHHPLGAVDIKAGSARGRLQPYLVLRVMDSQLWLQTAAFEWCRPPDWKSAGAAPAPAREPPCHLVLAEERLRMPTTMPLDAGQPIFSIRSYRIGGVEQHELMAGGSTETFRLGKRVQYREKTHAVLTISSGGEPHDRSMFEELSAGDQQVLDKVLQPELDPDRIREQIAGLATPLIKARLNRTVVRTVNDQAAVDPNFRATPDFPLAYLRQLDPQPTRDDVLKNESIIDTVRNMALGFPYTEGDAADRAKLADMLSLTADRFAPAGAGLFRFEGQEYVLRPDKVVFDVKDRSPKLFQVYRRRPEGEVLQPSSNVIFRIQGGDDAKPGSPSTSGAASIDANGNYTQTHGNVPDTPDVIQVFDPSPLAGRARPLADVRVVLKGFVRLADTVTVADAHGESESVPWTGTMRKTFLKPGRTVTLTAAVESTNGGNLHGAPSKVSWEIVTVGSGPAGAMGGASGNEYTAPDTKEVLEVTLKATSEHDPAVSKALTVVVHP